MSIFDFVKNAGEKIFKPGEPRHEAAIEKQLAVYGISGVSVEVDGDKATLSGSVKDTATHEKAVLIAGNIDGIGSVDDRIRVLQQATASVTAPAAAATTTGSTATPAASTAAGDQWTSRTYTVKAGDTLSKISKEMYGESTKYTQIFEANKPMLKDPDKIYPGQVLRVPAEQ